MKEPLEADSVSMKWRWFVNKQQTIGGILLLLCLAAGPVSAQEFGEDKGLVWSKLKGLEYRLKAGLNIGGTAPLPLPVEIRKIEGYNPLLSVSIEGNVVKRIAPKWAILTGVRLENKGMSTKARVKNYHIEIDNRNNDGSTSHVTGVFTGRVKTKVRNSYVSIPLMVAYKPAPRWEIKMGPYLSFLTNGTFNGNAFDGYIRENDPTGEKIEVTSAVYDFSGELKRVNWGINLGGEWRAYRHLNVYTDLAWGLNPVFKKGFESIAFNLYPIYANIGFGYVF